MEAFQKNGMRAVTTGVVAYGVSKLLGYGGDITLYNMAVDSNIAFGVGAGAGSLVGASVIQNVTSMISDDKQQAYTENRFLQPAVVGGSTLALANLAMGGGPTMQIFAIGAGSELVSGYIQDSLNTPAAASASTTAPTPGAGSAYV
jgi:hypothetical protein